MHTVQSLGPSNPIRPTQELYEALSEWISERAPDEPALPAAEELPTATAPCLACLGARVISVPLECRHGIRSLPVRVWLESDC